VVAVWIATVAFPAAASALPGPQLHTDPAALRSAVTSSGPDLVRAPEVPVLLVHGTYVTGAVWRGGDFEAFQRAGHPTCIVEVADRELGSVQDSVEYVVSAIRQIASKAGRPIAVVGHSQGAFLASMALRLWPDVAGDVTDFVGLAGVYDNGTTLADTLCSVPCSAAGWQLRPGSSLLTALHGYPLFVGPDYTAVSTATDEVVTPQPRGGLLAAAENIAVQDLCLGRYVEHGNMASDAVAYALARDAIEHPGPADVARVDPGVCEQQAVEGASTAKMLTDGIDLAPGVAGFYQQGVSEEPQAGCPLREDCLHPRLKPVLRVRLGPTFRRRVAIAISLELPAGALHQCAGRVLVSVVKARRSIVRKRRGVPLLCTLRVRARLSRHARRRRTVIVRYLGDQELQPTSQTAKYPRVPR
jgi:pimeloyl-ACP methyl ester carboxylesterase